MKNLKHIALLIGAGLILFSSCCKKGIPPQLEAIPANAFFVFGVENKQLIEKGDLKNYKEYRFLEQAYEQMKTQNPLMLNFVNQLMENPKSSGLDLDRSYYFGVKQDSAFYFAAVFKMDNIATFESNAQLLLQMQGAETPAIADKGLYKISQPSEETAFAWNKDLLFVTFMTDSIVINYDELFAMPKEKSIVSVADFLEFQANPYDMGFWMSYKTLLDFYGRNFGMQISSFAKEWENTYFHAYMNFEKGEAKLSGKMTPKAEVDKFYEKYPIIKKDFEKSILRDFPATSYFAMKASFNVKEYMKFFKDIVHQMDSTSVYPIDEEMLENPTANTIINALGGDMLLSLYGFAQGPLPLPLAGLCFTVNSEEDFNKLMALAPEETFQQEGDHYVMAAGGFVAIYVAYKDNKVFVTDDAEAIAAFMGKGYPKHLENGTLGENLNKSPFLYYVNLDINDYPENLRTMANGEIGDEILKYLAPYKDISFWMTSDYEGVISLKFKDKSQNSLKQLLKSIDGMSAAK